MRIVRDDREDKYTMVHGEGTTQLEETAIEKDLGMHIDNKLKFSDHINLAVNKAHNILGMSRRSFTYLCEKTLPTCINHWSGPT